MSNKGLYQTGLVFAVLTALGWILFVVGSLSFPQGEGAGALESYLARADSSAVLMYTWGGILGSLMVIPVFLALFQGFRRETGSILAVPITFAMVGVAFLTMGFMVDTGSMIYYFGPAVAAAEGSDAELMMKAAQFAQDSIEMTWAIGSFLAYGGSIVWIAILLFRASRAPRWMNWTGIIGGLAGFIWIVRFVPVPAPQSVGIILLMMNIVLVMVWLVGLSIVLARSGDEESVQPT
jgi:hypothetical protein